MSSVGKRFGFELKRFKILHACYQNEWKMFTKESLLFVMGNINKKNALCNKLKAIDNLRSGSTGVVGG